MMWKTKHYQNWTMKFFTYILHKQMAPLFTAFDHSTYQRVISQHLTDILTMPKSILTKFEQGAFVVSISGRDWHSVGLDKAHEMLINKGCKTSLTKPTPEQTNRMAKYLPYRSKMLENIRSQLIPTKWTMQALFSRKIPKTLNLKKMWRTWLATTNKLPLLKLLKVTEAS